MLYNLNQAMLEHDGESQQILLQAIKTIKEFDEEVELAVDEIIEQARSSCEHLLHWLYLASKGKINSTPTIGCSVLEVRQLFKNMEMAAGISKQSLATSPTSNTSSDIQKPLEIIAASSSSTQDFLSKLTQIHSSSSEKTTNSFKKLSDKVQKMMLIASSRGNVVAQELNNEALAFFKLQNFPRLNST